MIVVLCSWFVKYEQDWNHTWGWGVESVIMDCLGGTQWRNVRLTMVTAETVFSAWETLSQAESSGLPCAANYSVTITVVQSVCRVRVLYLCWSYADLLSVHVCESVQQCLFLVHLSVCVCLSVSVCVVCVCEMNSRQLFLNNIIYIYRFWFSSHFVFQSTFALTHTLMSSCL